jgi:hypothetical protein
VTTRTSHSTVTFPRSFQFAGMDAAAPAGSYKVNLEEERLDSLTVEVWRQTAVVIEVATAGVTEHVMVDPQELRDALRLDDDDATGTAGRLPISRNSAAVAAVPSLSPEALFRQSRVYAQGWNAARNRLPQENPAAGKTTANPYASEPEHSRWNEGYVAALADKRMGPRFMPAQTSRGPGTKGE